MMSGDICQLGSLGPAHWAETLDGYIHTYIHGYIDGYVVLQLVAAKYILIYLTRRLVGEVSTRLQVQVAILCRYICIHPFDPISD
jgi:hypothetical protein